MQHTKNATNVAKIHPRHLQTRFQRTLPASDMTEPAAPQTCTRPTLVLAGWRSFFWMPKGLAVDLHKITGNPNQLPLAYPHLGSLEHAAAYTLEHLDKAIKTNPVMGAFHDADTPSTVIAVSMGGLVARHMAMTGQLHFDRLYTLATPHKGAFLANWFHWIDDATKTMRPGSDDLKQLDEHLPGAPYKLTCFGRHRDWWVGTENLAPEGHELHTYSTPWYSMGHMLVSKDPNIAKDLAKMLQRDEAT